MRMSNAMTGKPHTIQADQLAVEAVEQMERYRINQLLVEDERGALIGALNMHDLFNAKVV
ncbi:putative KpsF/GutQ family protein (fragment) [Candidatus Glomeribacter gigasporarum BEG34]|uniref:Putative KpsF/GutQ family protein n=1 Tax=Candidatus Glomeribacter gigasporarum BEG34 TaxID=1070319 RepID=G2JC51_9BURK